MSLTIYANTGYAGGAFNTTNFPLTLFIEGDTAELSWPSVDGAISYSVYAGLTDDNMLPVEIGVTSLSAQISGLTQSTYSFQVIANLPGDNSVSSQIARKTPPASPIPSEPLFSGIAIIAVTGTAVRLPSDSLMIGQIMISADPYNAASIMVGGAGVNAIADGTGNGFELRPDRGVIVEVSDLGQIYINGSAGDYVTFIAV